MPRVSVLMSVFNRGHCLERSINSILCQSFDDFEFIICDDGSTDDSYEKLLEFAKKDNRIRILKNDSNRGIAFSLNRCLEISKGEYIARMDDDDYSHRYRFEKEVAFLDNHQKYSIVGSRRRSFDENGIWGETKDYGELTKIDIIKCHIFTNPSVMMRASDLKKVGGYTVSKRTTRGEDFDLWLKMYAEGYIGFVLNEVLLDYYEPRKRLKKNSLKNRYYDYKTVIIWRPKLHLSFWYNIYAFKHLVAAITPRFLLDYNRKRKQKK